MAVPFHARAAPPLAPTILILRAASFDSPRNRTARDRAAADRAATSDAPHARAPAAVRRCVQAAILHPHRETPPPRPQAANCHHPARSCRPKKSRIRVPAPSRARTHPDNDSALPPRAHGQNALPRAASLSSEAVSRPDVALRSFVFLLEFAS